MPRPENYAESAARLSKIELDALRLASERGWLTVTPAIGDGALAQWQRECERLAQPFAVIRIEPGRATLWFVLASGREWSDADQRQINAALAHATGFVVTRNHARVFAESGAAAELVRRLLAASAR
jgi:hypothetical protein